MKHTSSSHRIVVTGSESTGKTSLAKQLADHFDCPYSLEAARLYVEDHDCALTIDDLDPIATRQLELEETAIRKAHSLVIHDTDLLSTLIYAQHYYGVSPEWITNTETGAGSLLAQSRVGRGTRGDMVLPAEVKVDGVVRDEETS